MKIQMIEYQNTRDGLTGNNRLSGISINVHLWGGMCFSVHITQ